MGTDTLGYTVEETAKLLRIGKNTAYDGIASGDIPSIRIGKRIIVPKAALERKLSGGAAA